MFAGLTCRNISRQNLNVYKIQKRFRHKKKWASTKSKKPATEHALSYFDSFYKPVYGEIWPPMRAALLSQHKYCALINNFNENVEDIKIDLITEGADDFIKLAKDTYDSSAESDVDRKATNDRSSALGLTEAAGGQQWSPPDFSVQDEAREAMLGELRRSPGNTVPGSPSITDFMPVKRIVSERDELAYQEVEQGFYHPQEMEVEIMNGEFHLPYHLQAFVKERGDVSLFPPPSTDSSKKLGYYMMDGASILPVIALGVTPDDKVLDLCAAPGGKTLALLQTLLPGSMHCVDSSYSRLGRLKDILRWYLPRSYTTENRVHIIHGNGIKFCQQTQNELQFDKILVDVPCYTDRHVLMEEENNLFQPSRQRDRLHVQEVQKHLLICAMQSCRPGGSIVYSTCTLSMPQNDGVIQAALEHVWQESDIHMSVVDTTPLTHMFSQTFNFYNRCRYGQLVLPNLTANFGPMYFCKLQRIK